MEGGGDVAIALSDRPEVRAVIRAFADPTVGESWARADGTFFPPHQGLDLDVYADPDDRVLASAVQGAIEAGTFRFDASDQLPAQVTGVLHSALLGYVTDPDSSAEAALASVEAAWAEYEASLADG
jgi:alpha-glucoside transport system substrate-binding protein